MMGCLWTMLLMLEQIGCPLPERRALWGQTQTCYADAQGVCLWQQGQGRHEHILIEGSLEVKLPTIWTDEKQSWAGAERRGE